MAHVQQVFDPNTHKESDLKRVQASGLWVGIYRTKRQTSTYANVRISSCQSNLWWYKDLIDLEFFCELKWEWCKHSQRKYLKDVVVVRLGKSVKEVAMTIDPKDIELL